MPTRLCLEPRCASPATYRGRCQRHSREREAATHRNKQLYSSRKWQNTRLLQLHLHPLCECGQIATDVDHIVPVERGGERWEFTNLQSMCHSCHSVKTRREQATR